MGITVNCVAGFAHSLTNVSLAIRYALLVFGDNSVDLECCSSGHAWAADTLIKGTLGAVDNLIGGTIGAVDKSEVGT